MSLRRVLALRGFGDALTRCVFLAANVGAGLGVERCDVRRLTAVGLTAILGSDADYHREILMSVQPAALRLASIVHNRALRRLPAPHCEHTSRLMPWNVNTLRSSRGIAAGATCRTNCEEKMNAARRIIRGAASRSARPATYVPSHT